MPLQPAIGRFFPLTEIEQNHFELRFGDAKKIATEAEAYSEEPWSSITSIEVGDCITLFGKERIDGKVHAIFAFHFSSDTTKGEVTRRVKDYIDKTPGKSYRFCLIGGNQSPSSFRCVDQIKASLNGLVDRGYSIKSLNDYSNREMGGKLYIDANLRLKKGVVFSRY